MFGPYWSVTKYRDIMAVETNPKVFSSEAKSGGITIMDDNAAASLPMFIAMDPPKHDVQRKAVSPIVSSENLAAMQSAIRERTAKLYSFANCDQRSTHWSGAKPLYDDAGRHRRCTTLFLV